MHDAWHSCIHLEIISPAILTFSMVALPEIQQSGHYLLVICSYEHFIVVGSVCLPRSPKTVKANLLELTVIQLVVLQEVSHDCPKAIILIP